MHTARIYVAFRSLNPFISLSLFLIDRQDTDYHCTRVALGMRHGCAPACRGRQTPLS